MGFEVVVGERPPVDEARGGSLAMSAPELAGTVDPPAAGETPLEDVVGQIVALYRRAGRRLRAADPRDWAAGLTMPQLRVLFFLGRAGPSSVGEVAAGVGVSQPSATETLDRLVRAGLVARLPDGTDRRVVRNVLTAEGREMIDRPWETRRAVLASALRNSSPRDRVKIARGLELLCRALDRLPPGEGQGDGPAPPKGEGSAGSPG
jgi:DNA-binding MarR family transcriptional regulator